MDHYTKENSQEIPMESKPKSLSDASWPI